MALGAWAASIYMQGCMAAPEKRGTGSSIPSLSLLVNLILAIIGIVSGFMALPA